MPFQALKMGAAERTCMSEIMLLTNNWKPFLFVARCFFCLILPQTSTDYKSVLGMDAIHYDQEVIWWLCLWYAKPVDTGRHTNNDIAEKCVCIFMMYFCCLIRRVDASHGWDRSSQGSVNKNHFGAWNYRGWNSLLYRHQSCWCYLR